MGNSEVSLSGLSDEELMASVQAGEGESFEELYRRHAPRVFGYLSQRVADRALAEELLQETFLKVFRFRSQFDRQQKFLAWLFGICRNVMIDAARLRNTRMAQERRIREETMLSSVGGEPSVGQLEAAEVFLGELTEREREVIELRYRQDQSYAEISRNLGLSAANVRKIASRAIQRLRGK